MRLNDGLKRGLACVAAVAVCSGCACAALAVPRVTARAVDLPEWVANAAAGYMYFGIVDYTLAYYQATGATMPGALPLLCVQGALAYAYAHQSDISPTFNFGNDRYWCGFSNNYVNATGGLAFGSAYINTDCTGLGVEMDGKLSDDTPYSFYWLQNADFNTGLNPSALRVVKYSDGLCFISNRDDRPSTYYFPVTFQRDVWQHSLGVKSVDALSASRDTSYYTEFTFYSGGIDVSSFIAEHTSGTGLADDLAQVHSYFEETYPELPPELYFYTEEINPTDPSGCCCHHEINITVEPTVNVEVNVEPTVNVDVDVNVEYPLPSEWLETIPTETVENPLEELPTVEVENFTDILQEPDGLLPDSSGFWWKNFELWIKDNDDLWKYLLGLFTISVVGFILQHLG